MKKTIYLKFECSRFDFFNELNKQFESISKYKILTKLGNGSQGIVYKGLRRKDDKLVAIKTINVNNLEESTKFCSEISIISKLKHENICSFEEFYLNTENEELNIYLVMELYEYDLEKYLIKNKLSKKLIINYTKQIIKGLIFIHENKIIHRDLKTNNILMEKKENDYILKIADFGFATTFTTDSLKKSFVGTNYFAAPEIMRRKNYDSSIDFFSLGVIIYRMITLKDRIIWGDILDDEESTKNEIRLELEKENIENEFIEFILKLLSKNPNQRGNLNDLILFVNQ